MGWLGQQLRVQPEPAPVRISAGVVQLGDQGNARFVDDLSESCQSGDELIFADADHEWPATVPINGAAAQDEQPHPCCCPFDVEVDKGVGDDSLRRIEQMNGWHDGAVGQL